jgi:hypothetical protein
MHSTNPHIVQELQPGTETAAEEITDDMLRVVVRLRVHEFEGSRIEHTFT